jgi:hypothetical protein
MISRACRIATLSAGIDLSLIGKGETLNRPADVLAAIPNPGRDNPVPVGGFIQEWWATSSRYGGRHNLGIVGGFVRNQQSGHCDPVSLALSVSLSFQFDRMLYRPGDLFMVGIYAALR